MKKINFLSFKPYYNWNTFNTMKAGRFTFSLLVLNLIITGIPSIRFDTGAWPGSRCSFKPYYNWNTFNT